jgi:hypothetical protein
MKAILLCLCIVVLAGCTLSPRNFVSINPRYLGPDEIVIREIDASRLTYAFRGARGIYAFDLSAPPSTVKQVTFIFQDLRHLSSLSLQPSDAKWIQLYDPHSPALDGVTVVLKGNDWHATFTGHGLGLLRQGGRFQVIDEYRE